MNINRIGRGIFSRGCCNEVTSSGIPSGSNRPYCIIKEILKKPPFPKPHLQEHVNLQCKALGISSPTLVHIDGGNAFVLHLTIIIDCHSYDDLTAKAILNHEIGHIRHSHFSQRLAGSCVTIAPFFFNTTIDVFFSNPASFIGGILFYQLISKLWMRFQERQADAHCAKHSTAEELQALINYSNNLLNSHSLLKKPSNPSLKEKIYHVLDATHPYMEDRILVYQKALDEKRKNFL